MEKKPEVIHAYFGELVLTMVYGHNKYAYIIRRGSEKLCWWDDRPHHPLVRTHPHHFHPSENEPPVESKMIGDPTSDIPNLLKFIKHKV
ncbi:MAG: DUF6516 family protein [Methanosarcinales archaeon]